MTQRNRFCRLLAVVALWAAAGCREAPPAATVASPQADLLRETWEIYQIQGARAGYSHTKVTRFERDGQTLLRIEGLDHLEIQRFGQPTEQEIRLTSIETPDGRLLEFETEMRQGPTPLVTVGRVEGERLLMRTTSEGKTVETSIPWSADFYGFFGAEQSLRKKPLEPGERRTLHILAPGFHQPAAVEMVARRYEPVQLPTGAYDLLRIDAVLRFADGQSLETTEWADRTGETLRSRMEALQLEKFRATEELALEKSGPAPLDFGWDISVKVDRPLERPHRTQRVRYRVRLEGGDPAAAFVTGPSQQVRSTDAHTAEVTVYAIRPGRQGGNPDAPADPPGEADRRPNSLIQSDDRRIVAEAERAAGEQSDPWLAATALERYVHEEITEKDFSQAFASAAEVARTRQGDCTEHAVFLAALCRARGIPARAAIGLVYMPSARAFGYHMWTEAYVAGRWIPLDATLGLGGIGAAHLKIAQSHLEGASAYSSFLPVIRVVGRLRIEIVEVE